MTDIQNLSQHFQALGLTPPAARFLFDVWSLIQVFDDVVDGDEVKREDLDAAIWAAFIGLPDNPFFIENRTQLVSIMATQVIKWQASDAAERAGNADARSYMWRAGFYDLVATVALICGGPERAKAALGLYGETFEEYLKEFGNA